MRNMRKNGKSPLPGALQQDERSYFYIVRDVPQRDTGENLNGGTSEIDVKLHNSALRRDERICDA